MSTVRVELSASLCLPASVPHEIAVEIDGPVTQRSVLDAIEVKCPQLLGTIRDQTTKLRRPFIRFFACEEDLSHESPDEVLPEAVVNGRAAFLVIGAIAGG
jgi:hypothetical protein